MGDVHRGRLAGRWCVHAGLPPATDVENRGDNRVETLEIRNIRKVSSRKEVPELPDRRAEYAWIDGRRQVRTSATHRPEATPAPTRATRPAPTAERPEPARPGSAMRRAALGRTAPTRATRATRIRANLARATRTRAAPGRRETGRVRDDLSRGPPAGHRVRCPRRDAPPALRAELGHDDAGVIRRQLRPPHGPAAPPQGGGELAGVLRRHDVVRRPVHQPHGQRPRRRGGQLRQRANARGTGGPAVVARDTDDGRRPPCVARSGPQREARRGPGPG